MFQLYSTGFYHFFVVVQELTMELPEQVLPGANFPVTIRGNIIIACAC